MADLYNVMFSGEVAGRADPAVVRENLKNLFKANDAVLDRLFSGQPVAIKKMVDQATAMQLRARLKLLGANTSLVQVDENGLPINPIEKAPPPPANTMAAKVHDMAKQFDREEAAKPKPNTPPPPADVTKVTTWALYPVGALLGAPVAKLAPVNPDISKLSMSAIGAELLAETERQKVIPVQVDISKLSMSAPKTEVLNDSEREVVVPVKVDISALSMGAVGEDIEVLKEEKVLVNPDISHLSLSN